MEKPVRNDPCFCGSGKKFKYCCINKQDKDNSEPYFSIGQALDILSFGLSKLPYNNGESSNFVRVKEINITNYDTVICSFYPYSSDSLNIKVEIGYVVSFMFSFFNENHQFDHIVNFATKAFDKDDQEILYSISSKETAYYIAKGKSIDWIKNTIFEDNSDDHRLHIAKRKISEIEQGLRRLIVNILQDVDSNWWINKIPKDIRKNAVKFFKNQMGIQTNSGIKLIDFTYLLNLKTIIANNWNLFSNVFSSKLVFEKSIDDLNIVRRDEAHNRPISHVAINNLETIYTDLLGSISHIFPEIVPKFLVDNWRTKLKEIVNSYTKTIKPIDENKKHDLKENVSNIENMIDRLKEVEFNLNTVSIPPGKEILHNEIIGVLNSLRISFEEMIKALKLGDMHLLEKANEENAEANKNIKNFTAKYIASET